MLKIQELVAKKRARKEAKKAQLAIEKLASQVNNNFPGGVQKNRKCY